MRRIARLEHGRKWLAQSVSDMNDPFLKEISLEVLKEAENTSCEDWLTESLRVSG